MTVNRTLRRLACSSALLLAAAPRLGAQSQATTGIIRGIVSDSASGAPLQGAVLVARNLETNFARTVATNERGVYVATLLPLGTYAVTARYLGYGGATRERVQVRVGQSVDIPFRLSRAAVGLAAVTVRGEAPLVETARPEAATRLDSQVVSGLPNNGRNFINLTLLTPNVAVVQGPDGDEISIGGQRGIHNNVSVDGADFNNPFFGEQRGGQRPAFTFNLDAVQEVVVVSQGANAEFGRSGGGFVNVITKSGTNQFKGSAHYYGKFDALSGSPEHEGLRSEPDFRQHQVGFTLGGPIVRDKAFFFVAYDQQAYDETKHATRPRNAAFDSLRTYLSTAFGGTLANDFAAIDRSNDANALLAKLDVRLGAAHNFSLKYNWTNSEQANGTFDVPVWGRSANAVEKDYSHAVNGALASQLSASISNEFRFQVAREDRPRTYDGPDIPGRNRPFPDTGMDFANGFRFGLPFFIPVDAFDTRLQVLDNVSWLRGNHLVKVGGEWNRTRVEQTFRGFANGRFIFGSVTGFINYSTRGPGYVECSNGTTSNVATCPAGTTITGPVVLYLQQAGVGGLTADEAGTQELIQQDVAAYVQDTWKPSANVTVNYGLRWEAQIQPDVITPASEVFFNDFIGRSVTNSTGTYRFPSNGEIPSDRRMFQPRLGIAWDRAGNGTEVLRASAGLYYARIPGLNFASVRSTNGSRGQTLFRNSALTGVLGAPPAYDQLLPTPTGGPFRPDVFVVDEDFRNPRTASGTIGYERQVLADLAASVSYTYAATDFLTRFVNRNDPVFGSPFQSGLDGGANGIGALTVVESSAKSRYSGLTLGLKRGMDARVQFQANYTLAWDRSDDDNERDPFSFRYARADQLDREYGYSDRDQRHRLNLWALIRAPGNIYLNNRISAASAQPASAKCVNNAESDTRAASPSERICADGSIIDRNTLRKENEYFSWDVRASRPFTVAGQGRIEAIVEVFNLTGADNFRDPAASSLLFNFDGTVRSGLGDPRQVQAGVRWAF